MSGLHDTLANSHPSLRRGQVWCRTCRHTKRVDSAEAMRTGWPKCCGYTMTIDAPETWNATAPFTTKETEEQGLSAGQIMCGSGAQERPSRRAPTDCQTSGGAK